MPLEIPTRELIDSQIVLIDQELIAIASQASTLGLRPPPSERLLAVDDEYTQLQPATTPAIFWNHYIGGPLASVDVQMYLLQVTGRADEEIVSSDQGRLYRLATAWSDHPIVKSDPVNRASNQAFLKAGFSFEWMEDPSLTRKLKDQIADIGDFYTLREGYLPFSFTSMQQRRAQPSRAYLVCSNP